MHRIDLVEQMGRERQALLLKQAEQMRQNRRLLQAHKQNANSVQRSWQWKGWVTALLAGWTPAES